ncbi:hypothetical protein SCHPADRAFT_946086 [Schizopora paradoxa]|uniref:Uncharacterized protein n=1 Tax=Schizopora paradoxa TaxID=27342 RepID=A0A0H2R3P2_9AGAM|nr:hypothetical protein SCHPADRAFT_946086 [Schizopora paradoxa]
MASSSSSFEREQREERAGQRSSIAVATSAATNRGSTGSAAATQPAGATSGHRRTGSSAWALKRVAVAVAATKGLFGVSPPTLSEAGERRTSSSSPPLVLPPPSPSFKMGLHKSTSSPSLVPQDEPALGQRTAPSPRQRTRTRTFTSSSSGRPTISPPTHPRHLNGSSPTASLCSKLSYPSLINQNLPPVGSPSMAATVNVSTTPTTPRRRTTSAPASKFALSASTSRITLAKSPILLASPDEFGVLDLPRPTLPAASREPPTPTTSCASPAQTTSSPRSISSVRRKPVPRCSIRLEELELNQLASPPSQSSHLSPPPPPPPSRIPVLTRRRRGNSVSVSRSEVPPRSTSFASSPPASTPYHDGGVVIPPARLPQTPQQCSDFGSSTGQQQQQPETQIPTQIHTKANALSPLTLKEMDAIQSFARESATYENVFDVRASRRRRRARTEGRERRDSYHMHTAIVDSYFDGSDEDGPGCQRAELAVKVSSSSPASSLPTPTTPLRVNRETFGVYDATPVQSPRRARNDVGQSALLEGVVEDVDTTMEMFRPGEEEEIEEEGGFWSDSIEDEDDEEEEGDVGEVVDLGRNRSRTRRGGLLHAREEGFVDYLVTSTRPTFAPRFGSSSLQFSTDYRLADERMPSPPPSRWDTSRSLSHRTSSSWGSFSACAGMSGTSTPPPPQDVGYGMGIGEAILSREDIARFEDEMARSEECYDGGCGYDGFEAHPRSKFSISSESDHYHGEDRFGGFYNDAEDNNANAILDEVPLVSPLTDEDEDDVPPVTPEFDLALGLGDLSSSYDRLTSSLSKLRASHSPSRRVGSGGEGLLGFGSSTSSSNMSSATSGLSSSYLTSSTRSRLKPALRITSGVTLAHSLLSSSSGSGTGGSNTPSPPTPCSSLPPCSPALFGVPADWGVGVGVGVGVSAQENLLGMGMAPRSPTYSVFPSSVSLASARTAHAHAQGNGKAGGAGGGFGYTYTYGTPPVPSFLQLTPNDSSSTSASTAAGNGGGGNKRGRLRKLFGRAAGGGGAKK